MEYSYKRKTTTLSLKRKIDLITVAETSPSTKRKTLAEEFGIAPTTVTGILGDREKYKQQYYSGQLNVEKARARRPQKNDVDVALFKWYAHARSLDMPVNGPIMRTMAEEISREMGVDNWNCSEGWLYRFKKRHGISYKPAPSKERTVEEEVIATWVVNVLKPTLSKYSAKDVFSADEMGLFWRLLPREAMAVKSDRCDDGGKAGARMTVLVCVSMDGREKYPLFTVGSLRNPTCVKGVDLPVQYASDERSWMTSALFTDWLKQFDQWMASQDRKVLLVVDHCPAHPRIAEGFKATQLLFLPPDATSSLQPCQQGVARSLKLNYRRLVLSKLMHHADTGSAGDPFYISPWDALSMLSLAWDKVSPNTIASSFRNAGFTNTKGTDAPEKTDDVTIDPVFSRLFEEFGVSASDYVGADDDLSATDPMETPPLVTAPAAPAPAVVPTVTTETESDVDDCGELEARVSSLEALGCVRKIHLYLMQAGSGHALHQPFYRFRDMFEQHLLRDGGQAAVAQLFGAGAELAGGGRQPKGAEQARSRLQEEGAEVEVMQIKTEPEDDFLILSS